MNWKNLSPGRERLIYALGLLTGEWGMSEEKADRVYEIVLDTLENCMIYENPKGQQNAE